MPGPIYSPPELPWWLDPAKASVTDSLPVTLARKAAGLLGAGGDPGTAAMGMAGGPLEGAAEIPEGLVSTLLKRYRPTPNAEATGGLMNLLNGFRGEAPDAAQVLASSKIGGPVPSPVYNKNIIKNAISRVPEAEGVVESGLPPNGRVPRAPGLAAQYAREGAIRGKDSPEDLFLQQKTQGIFDRPAIRSLDELQDITKNPSGPSTPPPPISADFKTRDGASAVNMKRLALAGLDVDKVKAIRATGTLKDAVAKFPGIPLETLKGIVYGGTYGWIK